MPTPIETLIANARCIDCNIPAGLRMAVLISLADQIVIGGGGGGGGSQTPWLQDIDGAGFDLSNADVVTTNERMAVMTSPWVVPTLNAPGFLQPLIVGASDSVTFQGMVLATASAQGNTTITMMASAGTLNVPVEHAGAGNAINFMNYVGGAVADWRTFAVIEGGSLSGTPPTAEADVLGRIQLGACNGAVNVRPGLTVYPDQIALTDKVPLRLYNIGYPNVFDGISANFERFAVEWTTVGTSMVVIGNTGGGTGSTGRVVQVRAGVLGVLEINGGTGILMASDFIVGWSAAPITLGTAATPPDLRMYRVSAGVFIFDDNAGSFGRINFGGNTVAFPALKRSAALLQARLANDSAFTEVECSNIITNNAVAGFSTNTTLTDFAAAGAGTITNAPTAGNPTKWIAIDDNGTTRYIPTWT